MNLTFKWEELPRERLAYFAGYSSLLNCHRPVAWLPTGGSAVLGGLHQYLTYGGVLAGLPYGPESHERHVEYAIKHAAEIFRIAPEAVHVIPPVMLVADVSRPRNDGTMEQRKVEFLPPVCCLGLLESGEPVRDPREHGSMLAVVWFQRAFGLDDRSRIEEAFRGIPWEARAVDWRW
jgi:hypothetical protein